MEALNFIEAIVYFNIFIACCFLLCYSYQFFYIAVGLIKRPRRFEAKKLCKYAFLISARNESAVIGNLIDTINNQNYPKELIDIFIVADNCTDNTADIARERGAHVYERFNKSKVGKGFALDFLLDRIGEDYGIETFDGYFIFDADNLLDKNYVAEMNKVFSNGYRALTSYRNSKNYDSNWISAGYSLWFLREAKYLNNVRMMLKTSCAVSGTGFLVSSQIMKENNGWKYFTLTEDIEFSVERAVSGELIGYCGSAVFYDEQPTVFSQSWKQRLRWAKGYYQVIYKYGLSLFKNVFKKKSFSCFDMFMTTTPAVVFTMLNIVCDIIILILGFYGRLNDTISLSYTFKLFSRMLLNGYDIILLIGLITTITEWRSINANPLKKILYAFTFPIFMFTYIPISIAALFKKVKWEPISHNIIKNLNDVEANSYNAEKKAISR